MVARFANPMFEAVWNRRYVDHVQITAAETVGVGRRGKFYDATGALRDMVPNHLFELLAMVGMEPPNSFAAGAIRAEKTKVVEAVPQLFPWRGKQEHRARPLWCGTRRQRAASGLFGRTGRRSEEPHGDLCCDEIVARHLALVGRSFLPAEGQGDGAAGHRDRAPVQTRSLRAVPQRRCEQPADQPSGYPDPAR